jgi:hypothetical protein
LGLKTNHLATLVFDDIGIGWLNLDTRFLSEKLLSRIEFYGQGTVHLKPRILAILIKCIRHNVFAKTQVCKK